MASRRKQSAPQPPRARTALVVLGMHRSGTSALSGVLGQMGCDLPQDLMGPGEQNISGFFESNRITGLNDDVLASAGLRWFDFKGLSQDWYASSNAAEFTERALEALMSEFGQSDLFILKDPRICRLLPFWKAVFDQAGCAPAFICTHRDPRDVAASLQHWANYEPDYSLLLWLRHVVEAEAGSRGCRRVFTSYDRLMSNWSETIVAIGDRLGLNFPIGVETAKPAINAFLSAELQHFRQPGGPDVPGTPLPDWVAEAHEVLERWAAYGEDTSGQEVFDQIAAGLAAAGNSFAAVARRSQELRAEHADCTQALSKMAQQRDQLESQLAQRRSEADDLHRKANVDAKTIAALEKSLRDLEARNLKLERRPERDAQHLAMMTRQLTALLAQQIDAKLAKTQAPPAETGLCDASTGTQAAELATAGTETATRKRTLDQWIIIQLKRLLLHVSGADGKGG